MLRVVVSCFARALLGRRVYAVCLDCDWVAGDGRATRGGVRLRVVNGLGLACIVVVDGLVVVLRVEGDVGRDMYTFLVGHGGEWSFGINCTVPCYYCFLADLAALGLLCSLDLKAGCLVVSECLFRSPDG